MGAPKINGSKLKIFRIVITLFWLDNKNRKFRSFKKAFLLVEINRDVALG